MSILNEISENLKNGDAGKVASLTTQAIAQGLEARNILNDGLVAAMAVVGEKFKNHDIFLPDVLLAAKAMYAGMDILKPHFLKEGMPTRGRIVIGTVKGDLHDIGKNLVGIMLKGAGFEVIDLGKDVDPERFINAVVDHKADILGMSALLTTTMPVMKNVIELAKARGEYGKFKIIVGGAPLSANYAAEIGADAYCFDSVSAVDQIKRLLKIA